MPFFFEGGGCRGNVKEMSVGLGIRGFGGWEGAARFGSCTAAVRGRGWVTVEAD